jgi:microcin C transport system substrate-binding protein
MRALRLELLHRFKMQTIALSIAIGNVMTNMKTGETFEFEILLVSEGMQRVCVPFKENLSRIGITVNLRLVDPTQYINRLENFDFDMTTTVWGQSLSPGNEQRSMWSSEAADQPGSRNYAGIKDPVVDALIDKIINASSKEELVYACKALDRVLLWGHYVIPHWFNDSYRLVYWNKFGRPSIQPKYGVGFIDTWWVK